MTVLRSRDLSAPSRALAIGAHPDDVEFGAGATLARWAEAGCEVTLVVCTDGSKGTWDPDVDRDALIATRAGEQREAAVALGASAVVHHLGRVDGELVADRALVSRLAELIRIHRPDVLLGHDPWRPHRLHPDHAAAGRAVVEGLVGARDPHFFREHGVAPHRPGALLLFEAGEAADHIEVSEERHLAAKVRALEAHRSQHESTMGVTGADPEREIARFRQRITDEAATAGRRVGRSVAELFRAVPTDR